MRHVATGVLPSKAAEHLGLLLLLLLLLLPPMRPTTLSLAEREECAELSRRSQAYDEKTHQRGASPF